MRYLTLFLSVFVMLSSCNAQQNEKKKDTQHDTSSIEPQTEIKVNKEYDEQGNLIRYDSVYSSYYSNIRTDTAIRDSIFDQFMDHFHTNFPFSTSPIFNDVFFTDSLLFYDFYKDDFFQNRFRHNQRYMDRYFKEMDSLKNKFFKRQFPESEIN